MNCRYANCMRSSFLCILLILSHRPTFAQSTSQERCSPISYKNEMGPVRNQGRYGFCGSFTAADQIGQRMGLGGRVSALQVSLNGYNVLANGNKYPLLQEKSFKDKLLRNYNKTPDQAFQESSRDVISNSYYDFKGNFPDVVAYAFNLSSGVCTDDHYTLTDEDMGNLIYRLENNIYEKILPTQPINCEPKNNLSMTFGIASSHDLFFRLLNIELVNSCKNFIPLPKYKFDPKVTTCWGKSKARCLNLIHEGLSKGRIVGISYSSNRIVKDEAEPGSDFHASSIVGRKWNNQKKICEYEIRNSWGTGCDGYKNDPGISCAEGYLTVTENVLVDMIKHATFLK